MKKSKIYISIDGIFKWTFVVYKNEIKKSKENHVTTSQ